MADFEVKDGIAVIPEETEQIGSGAFGDLEGLCLSMRGWRISRNWVIQGLLFDVLKKDRPVLDFP